MAETLSLLEETFVDKIDYCQCLVEIFSSFENVKPDIRVFSGQVLKCLIDKKYIRMSEREVESCEQIKEKLTQTFLDNDK